MIQAFIETGTVILTVPVVVNHLRVQVVGMIRILAGIAPGDVHLTRGNVNDHGGNRVFAVQGVYAFDVMVANRIRQVDMILLDGLQGFYVV